jgi:hypothetical protein
MKHYKRYIEGKLSFHKLLKLKAKRRGIKRPFQEQTIGDDYYQKENKYTWMNRVIDRLHNWYSKIIKDKETGEIIHRCEEPLDKHIGHGSDKR